MLKRTCVDRRPARAPLDDRGRDRERQRRTRAEEGRACERADRAHGDRAVVDLERERLADPDERDDRERARCMSVAAPRSDAEDAGDHADAATSADEARRARGEREEARPVHACAAVCRRSATGVASGTRGGGARWSPSSGHGDERARCARPASASGSELAPSTRLRPWSFAR